tara:strand:- start:142 stop:348 length:207 start_codon:yes stop_codon:yes gene_type:complete
MTDKKQWGGKRPNQTGRPTNTPGVKRINFHCMVDPATKDLITRQAAKTKSSAGQVVDELASGLKPSDE